MVFEKKIHSPSVDNLLPPNQSEAFVNKLRILRDRRFEIFFTWHMKTEQPGGRILASSGVDYKLRLCGVLRKSKHLSSVLRVQHQASALNTSDIGSTKARKADFTPSTTLPASSAES